MLELAEMAEDDPLNAEAGGVISEDKGDPIMFLGGGRRCEGGCAGDGPDTVEGPVNHRGWKTSVKEEGGHVRGTVFESGIIRTDATEAEELGEWDGVLTGNGV